MLKQAITNNCMTQALEEPTSRRKAGEPFPNQHPKSFADLDFL
jgi:hypothetical protein